MRVYLIRFFSMVYLPVVIVEIKPSVTMTNEEQLK